MYKFIWNITKEINAEDSSTTYKVELNKEQSDPIFSDFEESYIFRDKDMELIEDEEETYYEWVEIKLMRTTVNYLSHRDPYNKIIDNTDIQFNYINNEEKL